MNAEDKAQSENNFVKQHKNGDKVYITPHTLKKVRVIKVKGYTDKQAIYSSQVKKELLEYAMDHNNSDEVACIIDLSVLSRTDFISGDTNSTNINADSSAYHMLRSNAHGSLELTHNHPGLSDFSLNDIAFFLVYSSLKTISIITNQGVTRFLIKTYKYDFEAAITLMDKLAKEYRNKSDDDLVAKFLKEAYSLGIERG